jgi:hypothetical protein
MGKLYLPSLEGKSFIKIENISQTEASVLVAEFDKRVGANRAVFNLNQESAPMIFYHGFLDLDGEDLEELELSVLEEYSLSKITNTRGARAVFVDLYEDEFDSDDDKNIVGVGTTVVYNQNRATVKFKDTTLDDSLKSFVDDTA